MCQALFYVPTFHLIFPDYKSDSNRAGLELSLALKPGLASEVSWSVTFWINSLPLSLLCHKNIYNSSHHLVSENSNVPAHWSFQWFSRSLLETACLYHIDSPPEEVCHCSSASISGSGGISWLSVVRSLVLSLVWPGFSPSRDTKIWASQP